MAYASRPVTVSGALQWARVPIACLMPTWENGQVVFQGTMREVPNGGVVVMIRLKVLNRQITEIENFVVRDAAAATALEGRGQPDAVFGAALPVAQRATRAELIRTVNAYLSGLQRNDGRGNYPMADDCVRIQNGTQVTNNATAAQALAPAGRGGRGGAGGRGATGAGGGTAGARGAVPVPAPAPPGPAINIYELGCMDQLKSGYFNYVTRVRDRRFVAVDRERGLVTAIVAIDQPSGRYREFKLADGRSITAGPERPATVFESQTYKIEGGRIRRIETVQLAASVPYGMIPGWSTWEDGMSSNPRDVR